MHETPGWKTDWEILLSKCATDEAFRGALGAALQGKDDRAVVSLLEALGIAGTDAADREARLKALKDAFGPMSHVVNAFGEHLRVAG